MSKVRTIDTHTHICTLETAAMLTQGGRQGHHHARRCRECRIRCRRRAVPAVPDRRLRHPAPAQGHGRDRRRRARALGHAADLSLQPGAGARPRSPPPSRTTRWPSTSPPIPRASWGSPRCRCRTPEARRRRTQARHDQARPARRDVRLATSTTRTWTIRASSRCGRRRRNSAPSCSSIRTMSPAPTG